MVEKFLFPQVTQTVLFDNICVIVYAAEIVMILTLPRASQPQKESNVNYVCSFMVLLQVAFLLAISLPPLPTILKLDAPGNDPVRL